MPIAPFARLLCSYFYRDIKKKPQDIGIGKFFQICFSLQVIKHNFQQTLVGDSFGQNLQPLSII